MRVPQDTSPALGGEDPSNPGPEGTRWRKQSWGAEMLGPWVPAPARSRPRRATTYTKTPKSRARTPISMASSRMVRPEQLPGRRRRWCSRRLSQLDRRGLARPRAAREARSRPRAGAGGGRRAGAGGRWGGLSPNHQPPRAPGLADAASAAPRPAARRRAGGALGTPRALAPSAASAPWSEPCARGPGMGGEARGSPTEIAAAAASPARSPAPPPVGGPCARLSGQRARWVPACGCSAAPGSASDSRSPAPGSRLPPARGQMGEAR